MNMQIQAMIRHMSQKRLQELYNQRELTADEMNEMMDLESMLYVPDETDKIGFCSACAIVTETLDRFGRHLRLAPNMQTACDFHNSHVLRSDIDGLCEIAAKTMIELMQNDVLPGNGMITITWNDNFLVISGG